MTKTKNNASWIHVKKNVDDASEGSYYRYLFVLLKLTGIKIELNNEVKRGGILWKLYLFLMILICFMNFFTIMQHLIMEGLNSISLKYLNLSDIYVPMGVLFIIIANRPINALVTDIWKAAQNLAHKQRIRFWFWLGIISFVVDIMAGYFDINNAIKEWQISPKTRKNYSNIEYFTFRPIANAWANIFCWFVLFNICIMRGSFANLNKSFIDDTNKGAEDKEILFQRRHLELSELVDRFNNILSPAIIVLVTTKMLQIISSIDQFKYIKDSGFPIENHSEIVFMVRSIIGFVVLVESGQRLRNHAGEGIRVLLKHRLQHQNVPMMITYSSQYTTKCPNCRVSALFVGQNVTSPVVISASQVYSLDYTLYLVVISVAITYTSLIDSMSKNFSCSDQSVAVNSTHS